jgi:hypothetical protein
MDLLKVIAKLDGRIAELQARRETLVNAAQIAEEEEEGEGDIVTKAPAPQTAKQPVASRQPPKRGDKRLKGGISIGDAVERILRNADAPMHWKDISSAIAKLGLRPSRQTLTSGLVRDSRKRFVRGERGMFSLASQSTPRQGSLIEAVPRRASSNGYHGKLPEGFSLIQAVTSLLPELHGDISQPVVFNELRARYPEAAHGIQKASIATTLTVLTKRNVLKVVGQGYGSHPKIYRKVG